MAKINIDLTTLSGWESLSSGTHSITVKAKATGYRDSEPSEAVTVTKGASGYTVNFLVYDSYETLRDGHIICAYAVNGGDFVPITITNSSSINNVNTIQFKLDTTPDCGDQFSVKFYSTEIGFGVTASFEDKTYISPVYSVTSNIDVVVEIYD